MIDTQEQAATGGKLNGQQGALQTDVKTLVRDAQALFQSAAALGGQKADEMRGRGMALLDQALGKAGDVRGLALERGKELAHTADEYVKENPWGMVAAAAGVGMLFGVLVSRR